MFIVLCDHYEITLTLEPYLKKTPKYFSSLKPRK